MEIKLRKLALQNFKGIKNKTIDFTCETNIYGQNASGKTTIFDAYLWLLFNKDSSNATEFNIKTLGADGKPIHQLEHSVEGSFEIDGQEIELKKVYKEKWTKKRGSQVPEFSGHETEYFISGVPKLQKEYKEYIDNIIDEETFKLISNPRYFSVDLDKKKRREILMNMANVDAKDVIAENKELKELDLEKYSIEDLEKMNKASIKKINEKLKEFPVRIDELANSIEDIDFDALEFQKKSVVGTLNHLDEEISKGDNTEALKEINEEISELVKEQYEIKSKVDKANLELKSEIEMFNKRIEIDILERNTKKTKKTEVINALKDEVSEHEKKLETLRSDYVIQAKKEYEGDNICPSCGQDLPHDQVQQAIDNFNKKKSDDLEAVTNKAKIYKEKIMHANERVEYEKSELEKLDAVEIQDKKEFIEAPYPQEYFELDEKLQKLKEKQKEVISNDVSELITKKKELNIKLDELNNKLAYKDINKKSKAKIDEYRARMKEYSSQFDEVQRILYLCEEYKRIESELINKTISDKFEIVEWRMYEDLINGGTVEACEALINGVPYSDANNAAKINAGIDIINTLSKEYGARAPIFVDNAESVNQLIMTGSQIVRLVVSEDEELTVEYTN